MNHKGTILALKKRHWYVSNFQKLTHTVPVHQANAGNELTLVAQVDLSASAPRAGHRG
jgi:hypothetical protein